MALSVGAKAPAFSLYDTDRKVRSLSEFLGKKLVLVFYPGAFTGVCTKEMCSFRDSLSAFNDLNAQVVGISVDAPAANKGFADVNKFTFPLLSDFTRDVSRMYAGTYMDFAGIKGYESAKRAVFVLDTAGTVKYVWISEDPGVVPDYDEVKSAVASF